MTGVRFAYGVLFSAFPLAFSFALGVRHNEVASSATNTLAVVNLCRGQHADPKGMQALRRRLQRSTFSGKQK